MEKQPTRSDPREERRFDRTQLRERVHGNYVHRDYLAHFFRWQYARRIAEPGTRILDVGCGQDQPLAKMLAAELSTVPASYVGVDLNDLQNACGRKWATVMGRFDFTSRWHELPRDFDLAVCFEVIEHMGVEDGARLLRGVFECLRPGGTFLLSTPVFSGVAARNHVHEYGAAELRTAIEAAGFQVRKRMGTFGDVEAARRKLTPAHLVVWNDLSTFLCNDALACFMAPLYPDACKNNMWDCLRPPIS